MARAVLVAVVFWAVVCVPVPAAQSELVIVKEKTGDYHRPSCPVVRDGRDVMAMTRARAEARGFKPHAACDPAGKTPEPSPQGRPSSPDAQATAPVFVYVAPGDNTYHRETCRKLGVDRSRVTLDEAVKQHWPCATCRPPIRKRTNPPAVPTRYGRG